MKSYLIKEDIQTSNKNMKRYLTSLAVREMQIKTTIRKYYASIRKAKIIFLIGNIMSW